MKMKNLLEFSPGTRFLKQGVEYVLTDEYYTDQCPRVVRLHDGKILNMDGYTKLGQARAGCRS